ncbi:P-loop NTPase fold protein [Pseudanabaena sp. FACHB-2040]|uniref:AAA family ATPase n=1 Tax=Pseudanabaena sp. FACHB-2040 TaxID=2692859 RepID=UPI00168504D7|nr:P-loop NTPase fold protein [Pseudanabaena sp. FACHB-2040]MBD2259263.1 ATP-binding protein [Pseudanabaena sp. FACHB-2040]
MTSLEQLVQRSVNPFDPATFKPGNFWQEAQNPAQEVTAIHQEAVVTVEDLLEQVRCDRISRTLLLAGDSGSGKSYLLGRLKRRLNDRAFFAYIGPWPDSQYLWRHVLRNTVDSLVHAPEGKAESQLLLWLKSLPSLKEHSLLKWVQGERSVFIRELRASFPAGIYNAKEFFGVLYDLTNPDLRPLACDWLRGDDLDEEDLSALRVKASINSEDAAQKILMNFGRISGSTQPIVLCFDNLDNIPKQADGKPDLQALFNVNSTVHNESLNNFVILISIITGTWRQYHSSLQPADKARINCTLTLKGIHLDQAESLWASRLADFHQQAEPKPESAIAPLTRPWLESKFPGGRALPRNVLMLGQQLIKQFKDNGHLGDPPAPQPIDKPPPPPPPRPHAAAVESASFDLLWQKEFQKVRGRLSRISQLSSPELIWRLREALEALQIPGLRTSFLKSPKFSAYSLAHEAPVSTGIIWTEDRNMTSFYHLMRACEKAVNTSNGNGRDSAGKVHRMYLIRAEDLGRPNSKGHQIYRQVFAYANYLHVIPDLLSVHYLETYHALVNAASGGELVVGHTTPTVAMLQEMVRQSGSLNGCPLLHELEVVPEGAPAPPLTEPEAKTTVKSTKPTGSKAPSRGSRPSRSHSPKSPHLDQAKEYILSLMTTQGLMGVQALTENTLNQVSGLSDREVKPLIQQLCQENRLQFVDPNAAYEAQLICLVPE